MQKSYAWLILLIDFDNIPEVGFYGMRHTAEKFQFAETFNESVNVRRVTVQLWSNDATGGSHTTGSIAVNTGGRLPFTFYVDIVGQTHTDLFLAGSFTSWETNQVQMAHIGNNFFSLLQRRDSSNNPGFSVEPVLVVKLALKYWRPQCIEIGLTTPSNKLNEKEAKLRGASVPRAGKP